MRKSLIVASSAFYLFSGLAGVALAQNQSGGGADSPDRASGRSATDQSYSPGNPSPNDQIGDHPSSGDDKRGYDSDDAH